MQQVREGRIKPSLDVVGADKRGGWPASTTPRFALPLETHEVVVNLIGTTRTKEGLEVHAWIDEKEYEGAQGHRGRVRPSQHQAQQVPRRLEL